MSGMKPHIWDHGKGVFNMNGGWDFVWTFLCCLKTFRWPSDRLRCRETTRPNERTRIRSGLVSRVSSREILDGWHQVLLSQMGTPKKNQWDTINDAFWWLLGSTALWPSYLVYAVVCNSEPFWCCRFLGTSIGNHGFYMFLLWTIPSPQY
jgi:hypothetical protein